jgi:hypothetical protein
MDVLVDEIVTARKTYFDDAYFSVMEFVYDEIFSYQEYREIIKVKKQKGKILPGQKYRRLVYKDNGQLITWRESLSMSNLMHKYELYEEW